MVDRYAIHSDSKKLAAHYNISTEVDLPPKYNCAPTHSLPITTLSEPGKIQLFHWGLIAAFSNNKRLSTRLFNSDFQQTLSKPSIVKQLKVNRCLIYATGFYLWKPISKKNVSPYYVHYPNHEPFVIAGIWENYESMEGQNHNTFQMITTGSPSGLATYQEDVPLILGKDDGKLWLNAEVTPEELAMHYTDSFPQGFSIHPVSPAIQNPNVDDPNLIRPIKPTDQHGNYTLFG